MISLQKLLVLPLLMTLVGCVAVRTIPNDEQASEDVNIVIPTSSLDSPNNSPRVVIPATGGVPVMAIPIGGDIYLPVTGGPPIIGVPIN